METNIRKFKCDFCDATTEVDYKDPKKGPDGWGVTTVVFYSPDKGEAKHFCRGCAGSQINKLFTTYG